MANRRVDLSAPVDRLAARSGDAILLVGRLLIAAIFIQSGYDKLMNPAGFVAYLGGQGVPLPLLATWIGIVVELAGAAALIAGWQVRWGAVLLLAFMVVATLIGHRYWDFADEAARRGQLIHFLKNLAMIGGLLVLFVNGGGKLAIERLLGRR
jgi:putative oxidoreductase